MLAHGEKSSIQERGSLSPGVLMRARSEAPVAASVVSLATIRSVSAAFACGAIIAMSPGCGGAPSGGAGSVDFGRSKAAAASNPEITRAAARRPGHLDVAGKLPRRR